MMFEKKDFFLVFFKKREIQKHFHSRNENFCEQIGDDPRVLLSRRATWHMSKQREKKTVERGDAENSN